MKITNIYSATVLIEDKGVKLLCDPWLVDGEYYGSWFCYPSLKNFDFSTLEDVDFTISASNDTDIINSTSAGSGLVSNYKISRVVKAISSETKTKEFSINEPSKCCAG